jgi:hypothetical protein
MVTLRGLKESKEISNKQNDLIFMWYKNYVFIKIIDIDINYVYLCPIDSNVMFYTVSYIMKNKKFYNVNELAVEMKRIQSMRFI